MSSTFAGKIVTGQSTITTTAARIVADSTQIKMITLRSNSSNGSNKILLGDANGQTFELQVGESVRIYTNDLYKIYAKSSAGSPKLDYIGG